MEKSGEGSSERRIRTARKKLLDKICKLQISGNKCELMREIVMISLPLGALQCNAAKEKGYSSS